MSSVFRHDFRWELEYGCLHVSSVWRYFLTFFFFKYVGMQYAFNISFLFQLYQKSGQIESSVDISKDYLKGHLSEADFGLIDLLASMLVQMIKRLSILSWSTWSAILAKSYLWL